jgi:hypothetical protein
VKLRRLDPESLSPKYVLLLKGKGFDNIRAIMNFDTFHPKLDELM